MPKLRFYDKNGKLIKVGMKIRDKEGTYDVIEYNGCLAISSKKSIWSLTQFSICLVNNKNVLFDFEIVKEI